MVLTNFMKVIYWNRDHLHRIIVTTSKTGTGMQIMTIAPNIMTHVGFRLPYLELTFSDTNCQFGQILRRTSSTISLNIPAELKQCEQLRLPTPQTRKPRPITPHPLTRRSVIKAATLTAKTNNFTQIIPLLLWHKCNEIHIYAA